MRSVKRIICEFSSKLISKEKFFFLVFVSLFLYSGLFLSLHIAGKYPHFIAGAVFDLSFPWKLILIYFGITLIFALGLSQAGFVVIPLLALLTGFSVSFLVLGGINAGTYPLLLNILPFVALLMACITIYGAAQMNYSWNLFCSGKELESLSALQENIKLYYFTIAFFALLAAVIAGFGFFISFVFRSLL